MYDLVFYRQRRYYLRPTWSKTEGRSRIITNIENGGNNIKILIVDDDPDMVLTFKTGLES